MKENQVCRNSFSLKRFLAYLLIFVILLSVCACQSERSDEAETNAAEFIRKTGILEKVALQGEEVASLPVSPAGKAGYAVFFSVCDKTDRASVFTGTGSTLPQAWAASRSAAEKDILKTSLEPVWVKVDIVFDSEYISESDLIEQVKASRHEFYRYGIAFDDSFNLALLEAEMNGAKIYDYDNGGVDLDYLNSYLKKAGRESQLLERLPSGYTIFQCYSWFLDEDDSIYPLISDGLAVGRRDVELVDKDYVETLIMCSSAFLMEQAKEDGSFVYGIYPRFDNEIDNYNIVRHTSTVWSLLCRYRMAPSEDLKRIIDNAIDYVLRFIIYSDENTAYLYEEKADEIKLGGCGMAIVMLTEYMDVFQTDDYKTICWQLGNGILSMLDQETGEYYHVLNGDFSRKEEYRTVYYDGEATFGLCRLYGITGEKRFLDAAKSAVSHFIEADYTQYKDHWIAYAMNEITKYIPDDTAYYDFALANAQNNLQAIYERDTTYHTYLELLMVTFELYDRMVQNGIEADNFDLPMFLKTIYTRADRMLNGFFFPEYAMYMKNPQRILYSFMVRHDGYRVRIDDVQHNIGAYYKYYVNYDNMVEYGLLEG